MISINITTTRQRLQLCKISLLSLLMQSENFDCVNVWISEKPYLIDTGIEDERILEDFLEYFSPEQREKIRFRWVQNTGPYRKLLPALRTASCEDIIVTADDDIFYGENWLKNLITNFLNHQTVVACRVRNIKRNCFGFTTSYLHWTLESQEKKLTDNYVITFGGGVVLTRHMFSEKDLFNDDYLTIAPTSDDLWYSKLLRRSNREVHVLPSVLNNLNFIEHNSGLIAHNLPSGSKLIQKFKTHVIDRNLGLLGVNVCENDLAFKRIEAYFKSNC